MKTDDMDIPQPNSETGEESWIIVLLCKHYIEREISSSSIGFKLLWEWLNKLSFLPLGCTFVAGFW